MIDLTGIQSLIVDSQRTVVTDVIRRDLALPSIPFSATAVVGCRRCGKTFRTYQFIQDCRLDGTPPEAFCRIQFNDLRLSGFTAASLLHIDRAYYSLFPQFQNAQVVYFLFDEMQRVEGWEDYVLQLLDRPNHRVILTGSTSRMLSGMIAGQLRGKCLASRLHCFSFREFLRYHGIEADTVSSAGQSRLSNALLQYVEIGGYAGLYRLDPQQRAEGLQGYWQSMLLRDVVEAHPDDAIDYSLLTFIGQSLMARIGSPVTINKLKENARAAGHRFADDVPALLLRFLEEAFAVKVVTIVTQSERVRNRNYQKVYASDWALANAVAASGSLDRTRLFENLVHAELLRRGEQTSYYLTAKGFEIDFVTTSRTGALSLYQVCYALNEQSRERELRGIPETVRFLGIQRATIVTMFDEGEIDADGVKVRVVPAWRWLLEA